MRLVTSYRDDLRRFPEGWHKAGLLFWAVLIVGFGLTANGRWLTIANLGMVGIVGSVGLMILTGFAGQISLGHAAFLGLGAYTTAVMGERWDVPFWAALPVSGAVAAGFGLLVGPFALRLRGLYLAIVTLGALFAVQHLLLSFPDWTHGVSGIAVPMHTGLVLEGKPVSFGGPPQQWLGVRWTFDRKLYWVFVLLALGTTWMGASLARSNTGRAMMAVRDGDVAASILGVNPARSKVIAFGISSFLAGVAGGMFALQQQYLTISPPFDLNMSVQYIAMIVLGGVGTIFGAVAGALAFAFLTPMAEAVGEHLPFISELSSHQQSTVLFAILVIVVLVFEPMGLFGVWLRVKRYFLAWPFRY